MAKKPKQPKLLRGSRRNIRQRIQGASQRVGGIAAGQSPDTLAPRSLPNTLSKGPSLKPRKPRKIN